MNKNNSMPLLCTCLIESDRVALVPLLDFGHTVKNNFKNAVYFCKFQKNEVTLAQINFFIQNITI